MGLRAFLSDDLPDLKVAKHPDQPRAKEHADRKRGEAGRSRTERDVARHVQRTEKRGGSGESRQHVTQHQPSSATSRATPTSVGVPREPLTSTRSPGLIAFTTFDAASSLFSKYRTEPGGIPAATAASASARAGAPPIAKSTLTPAAAAARPLSSCSKSA